MATQRPMGRGIQLKAYAGTDPATGKRQYLYDQVPADVGKRELDRRIRELDARAHALAESRRDRRRNPDAPKRAKPRPKADRTVADAVEAWWKHHGSKLAGAPKRRSLIDGIVLPHLGHLKVALMAGTPPDDEDERDPDLVYLSEKWEEIRLAARKIGDEPLAASTIHTCHTSIVGPALRRAGHPIPDPGLPAWSGPLETTPLPEELTAFLPHLAGTDRAAAAYTVTRRVRGTDQTVTYEVPARPVEPNAMDLMTEAFALLVANGPRPVEAAAITRAQIDLADASLGLDGRGVVEARDDQDREIWVIANGETAKRRRRIVTLDPRTLTAVKIWLTFQDQASLALGERLTPRSLVFSLDPVGRRPMSPKVFSGAFARAVARARAAGVALPEGFHLYDMRHFGITHTLRLGQGRNVAAVAKRFGTSTRMIESRYEHAIPKDDRHLAAALGSLWGEANPAEGVVVPFAKNP